MQDRINNKIPAFLIGPEYRVYRHLILQVVILLISVNVFWDEPHELVSGRFGSWLGYYILINAMVYFNMYVLVPRLLLKDKILLYAGSALALVLFSVACIGMMQSYFSPDTPSPASPDMGMILLGVASSILSFGLFTAGISAFLFFKYRMQQSLRIGELESATLQSELGFLKSQINPHFLFNMLNNANVMIYEDAKVASRILAKLNDLLHYQLNDSLKEEVWLGEDLIFLDDFLGLEKIRRDQFEYTLIKDGDVEQVKLPPLLFIPFVENAVKHSSDSQSPSYVHIRFRVEDHLLFFFCRNSKPEKMHRNGTGGLGLANIKRRLDLLFGENYLLDLSDEKSSYSVNLKLKL